MSFLDTHNPLTDDPIQIMDSEGKLNEALRPAELTDEKVKEMYEKMVFVRMVDDRMKKMQRSGRMGTFASIEGQEAAQMGSVSVLEKSDWVVPAFREQLAMWMHGVPLESIMLFWKGNEAGGRIPDGVNVLPVSIPVGSQMVHAVGLSWAHKLRSEKNIALTYFGDGATSEGDFHEAMNFAGVYKTGTVFLCQNNQFAISVPRRIQTASKTIAQKAIAYGFPGVVVDGNDLFAMYAVTKEAVERARRGDGPTLIEAYTYRLGDHTSSDDATKYREKAEVEAWRPKDPLRRLQLYLATKNLWSEQIETDLKAKLQIQVDEIVAKVDATPDQTIDELFAYTYATLPQNLANQKAYMKHVTELQAAQKGGSNA
jgi:pyruvate dehydrogenase E1 component alpha subunit